MTTQEILSPPARVLQLYGCICRTEVDPQFQIRKSTRSYFYGTYLNNTCIYIAAAAPLELKQHNPPCEGALEDFDNPAP